MVVVGVYQVSIALGPWVVAVGAGHSVANRIVDSLAVIVYVGKVSVVAYPWMVMEDDGLWVESNVVHNREIGI